MKMNRKIGVFVLLIVLLQNFDMNSQLANHSKLPCENVEYHLNFFNIRRGPKNLNPTIKAYGDNLIIDNMVMQANLFFKESCIQFKYCIVDTLNEYNYYLLNEQYTAEDTDMMLQYNKPYSINVYWVNVKKKGTFNGICAEKNDIAGIQFYMSGAADDDTTFIRILWQYFGLDIQDPIFKEYNNPLDCRKFSREQLAFLISNEKKCRKKRWD